MEEEEAAAAGGHQLTNIKEKYRMQRNDGRTRFEQTKQQRKSVADRQFPRRARTALFLKKKEAPLTQYQVNGNGREKRGLRK